MSIKETAASSRALSVLGCLLVVAVLACALMGLRVPSAYADGGVLFVGAVGVDVENVSPKPSPAYTVALEFDKNVGYANQGQDTSFIAENVQKVHLLDSRGNEVEGVEVRTGSGRDDRRIIYVRATEWLAPLTAYTIHIDAGIQAANGADVSAEPYDVSFRTSAEMPNGLTLYENVLIPACIVAVVAGIAVMVVRGRKERR